MKRVLLSVLVLLLLLGLGGALTFYLEPIWVSDQVIRAHLRVQNVQSKFIDVDGYKIHYFEAVPPARLRVVDDGMPLVLVHGLGSKGEDWSGLIPTLAANGFHVYVPDLLGWLEDLQKCLKPGGTLGLAIPDRRFTFDRFRRESVIAEAVEAYLLHLERPSGRSSIAPGCPSIFRLTVRGATIFRMRPVRNGAQRA